MSRSHPIFQCKECGVDIGPLKTTDLRICPTCYDRCFSFVYFGDDEGTEEEGDAA